MPPLLIGLDCAASPLRMGCMLARLTEGRPALIAVATEHSWDALVDVLAGWMRPATDASPAPALLCMDAPLGWPRPMAVQLAGHQAGQGLPVAADQLFSRRTDREVAQRLGKRPMEVGANYIARAALAAVNLLERLRRATGLPLPLGWTPGRLDESCAIEVYPAGVLAGRGMLRPSYKKTAADRASILAGLATPAPLWDMPPAIHQACLANDHLLDAALCCLAGADYLQNQTPGPGPEDAELARVEGWIWTRSPSPCTTGDRP